MPRINLGKVDQWQTTEEVKICLMINDTVALKIICEFYKPLVIDFYTRV